MSFITFRVAGVDKIFVGGDLSLSPSSTTDALVTGLQGIPISSSTPNDSDVLTYSAISNLWHPAPGGGGATQQNFIGPGLHGIVGDGITDDAPAIQAYLNSLCTHFPSDTPTNIQIGNVTRLNNVVTVTANPGASFSFVIGNIVRVASSTANFPSGTKVITSVGGYTFIGGKYRYTTFTYAENGANATNTAPVPIVIDRVGASVNVLNGTYRLGSTVTLNACFTLEGAGVNTTYSGTIFVADAGVTAFALPGSAFGTIIRGITVNAAGKTPLPNTPGQLNHDPGNPATLGDVSTFLLNLTNPGDAATYHNGDVIRVEGASQVVGPIYNLQCQTTLGSANVTFSTSDSNTGFYEGMHLLLPGAFGGRTSLTNISPGNLVRTGGNTVTITTLNNHGLAVGDKVGISTATADAVAFPAGSKTITATPSPTTAQYSEAGANTSNTVTATLAFAGGRIISYTGTGSGTITMDRPAAATVHYGAVTDLDHVLMCADAVLRINSGGGTQTLIIEDDTLLPYVSTFVHPFASAFYTGCQIHFDDVLINSFKGSGLVLNASTNFLPAAFGEASTTNDVQVYFSGFGYYGKGVDSNTQSHINFSANFGDMLGIYTEQYIGVKFVEPITQVIRVGFAGGFASNQGINLDNQYAEAVGNAMGGGVITIGGGAGYSGQAAALLTDGSLRLNSFFITAAGIIGSYNSPTVSLYDPIGGVGRVLLFADAAANYPSNSDIMDIRTGGTRKFRIRGDGAVFFVDGAVLTSLSGNSGQLLFETDGTNPIVGVANGDFAPSSNNGASLGTKFNNFDKCLARVYGIGVAVTPLTIVGTTITPTLGVSHLGAGTFDTITVPTWVNGTEGASFTLWPDAAFTWTTGGNIAVAGTAVINRLLTFIYDHSLGLWAPSYVS